MNQTLKEKHGTSDISIDPRIKDEILRRVKNNQLPCAVAFQIANFLDIPPAEVGKTADFLNIRLAKCQMGLFGYQPKKKIVKKISSINTDLKHAIENSLVDQKLTCAAAWRIANEFKVSKMTVSNTCETLGIRMKSCQLGAF